MWFALVISTVATIIAALCVICTRIKGSKKNRYCGLLVVPIMLTCFAVFFGIVWFFFGKELTPQGDLLWRVLERGSLDAIETVAGVLGISNILVGWIYAERDKPTLGKSLLELIEYQFGRIYTWSVATHFFATALCLLLTKVGAREGAFFSFLALSVGCVPQAMICFKIGLNPQKREECSIELWKNEQTAPKDYKAPVVIKKMIRYLSDPSVYAHEGYQDMLFKKLAAWLGDFPEVRNPKKQDFDEIASDLYLISNELHTLLENVPELERDHFLENLFGTVCEYLDGSKDMASACTRVELLCCGYIHCIYNFNETDGTIEGMERKIDILASRLSILTYYFRNKGAVASYADQFLQRLLGGLEWYLFLTQRVQLPRYAVCRDRTTNQVSNVFVAMICSIFNIDDQSTREKNARIAWDQA